MFITNPITTAILAAAAAYSPAVLASTDTESYTLHDTVVVTGRSEKSISDIPGTVWVVNDEQIEQEYRGGKNLSEILASSVPALDFSSQGRTNYGQNMRGRPMLVMIDGVSLNSSRSVSRQLDAIDPFNIASIEVLSGASSIYGAGATGGIINIITKRADGGELAFESYAGTTSGFNGSDDFDYKLAQSISGGNDTVNGRVSVVYGANKGAFDADGDIIVPDITQGSLQFNEVVDLLGTLTITQDDNQSIQLLAQYYSSKQDSPYGIYFGENLAGAPNNITGNPADTSLIETRKGFSSDRQGGTERLMLNASYHHSDVLGQDLFVQASFRREEFSFIPFIYGSYLAASEQNTDVLSLRAAMVTSTENLTVTYGIDSYLDKLSSNQALFDRSLSYQSGGLINKTDAVIGRYPGTEVASIAGFIQADYQLTDDWSLSGGYRYQWMQNSIDDFVAASIQQKIALGNGSSADAVPGGTTDYTVGLFNLGTVYKLSKNAQVWANLSQGFDLADPAKYYGQGSYSAADANGHYTLTDSINVANSKMQGIKTNSIEIGARQQLDALSWQAAAYISESDKTLKYNKKTLNIDINDAKKRIYGIEAEVAYWLTDNLQTGITGHWVDSKEQDSEGNWSKMSVNYASASKAGAWVGWYEEDYALKLQSQTLFDLEDDNDGNIDGYSVFDLIGSVNLPKGSLGFGIQNLLNEDYTTVWGQRAKGWYSYYGPAEMFDYKGRGRTYTLNYQLKY
ncbi:TonB-dependent receptor [Enterovibrio paralichthyis]|uniref:TonB-dependent receptor n=1 Tax=Enterovibrio paralichthyis TaxID=2853805 RepID=UPI001C482CD9|nr:TonB-dependent receptor [Enterovibrio paralichthyis]MBV7299910.1 TonB-dependent receptor [Enterovibrio paralichthyis]